MQLKELRLPYQVQIGDIVARSGFAVGSSGVTEIKVDRGLALVKRSKGPDLVFSGQFYGIPE